MNTEDDKLEKLLVESERLVKEAEAKNKQILDARTERVTRYKEKIRQAKNNMATNHEEDNAIQ